MINRRVLWNDDIIGKDLVYPFPFFYYYYPEAKSFPCLYLLCLKLERSSSLSHHPCVFIFLPQISSSGAQKTKKNHPLDCQHKNRARSLKSVFFLQLVSKISFFGRFSRSFRHSLASFQLKSISPVSFITPSVPSALSPFFITVYSTLLSITSFFVTVVITTAKQSPKDLLF